MSIARLIPVVLTVTLLAITTNARAQLLIGPPTDDVWAYSHAASPGSDPIIRVWGANGLDINPTGYPGTGATSSFFSYGFISWDLSTVPPGYQWNGATVSLTLEDGTVYDPATDNIYLRLITDGFDENTWAFGVGPAPISGDQNRIEGDDSQAANGAGSTVTFDIPRNVPRSVLLRWARNRRIDVAITSTADFAAVNGVVRIASRNNLLYDGPTLELN